MINLKGLIGGGGVSEISFFSKPIIIPTASPAGTLFAITPPAGKRVILTHLSSRNEVQATCTLSGSVVGQVVAGVLGNEATIGVVFMIGQVLGTIAGGDNFIRTVAVVESMAFAIDEVVMLTKTSPTTQPIHYAFTYGS